jgi:3-phosphoglycerate kinase
MAYTFLKAKGLNIGKSILDSESLEFCQGILANYPDKIVLPVDHVVTTEYSNDTPNRVCKIEDTLEEEMGLDIGPETIELFSSVLDTATMVFWNGPLVVYEFDKYTNGSEKVLEKLVSINATTILGGGDIVAAATKLGYKEKVTHASTGGGVTLEFMEGKELPGVSAIENK